MPETQPGAFARGVCAQQEERWEEAAGEYREAMVAEPLRLEIPLRLGICLLHLDAAVEALRIFAADAADPALAPFYALGQAAALRQLGDTAEADALVQRVLESHPGIQEHFAQLEAGDFEPCRPAEVLTEKGVSRAELEARASTALSRRDYRAAWSCCTRLAEMAPDCFEAWFNLGAACQALGATEDAIGAFHQALAIHPDSFQTCIGIGMAWQAAGETGRARDAYERALGIAPGAAVAQWNLALIREEEGDYSGAAELYDQLVGSAPGWVEAYFRLGVSSLRCQLAEQAAAAFRICLENRNPWTEATYNLGLACLMLREPEPARQLFEEVLRSEPRSVGALRGLASIALEAGDHAEALRLHLAIADAGDRSAAVYFNCGALLQSMGRQAESAGYYQKAIAAEPDFAEAVINLAVAVKGDVERLPAPDYDAITSHVTPALSARYFERLSGLQLEPA